eukprot:COSAG05_NODE_18654_length_305_cov_0.718447_1_plen_26_part_10
MLPFYILLNRFYMYFDTQYLDTYIYS